MKIVHRLMEYVATQSIPCFNQIHISLIFDNPIFCIQTNIFDIKLNLQHQATKLFSIFFHSLNEIFNVKLVNLGDILKNLAPKNTGL